MDFSEYLKKVELDETRKNLILKSKKIVSFSPHPDDNELVSGDKPQDGDGFWDLYEEDMRRARSLGNNAIRMSIEWARIFREPTFSVDAEFTRNDKGEPLTFTESSNMFAQLQSNADKEAMDRYSKMVAYAHSLEPKRNVI